jgi:hypothetical protein
MNMRILIRLVVVALLGAAAASLVSCGSSGKGLIPATKAGPLQKDFEAVAQAAEAGDGNCARTESALGKTEQDFLELPATVDAGLHKLLEEGITNLHKRALAMCIQPASTATGTTSTPTNTITAPTKTSTTETTTTPATTPSTTSTPTTTQTPPTTTSPNPSGGTEAGGEHSNEHGSGASGEQGAGAGAVQENGGGGSNVGGASPGAGQ